MESYFSDIRWGYHYLRGSGPANLAFVLTRSGYRMPVIETACDLAFGQGMTININAATNRDTAWYGTDFNSQHAATARQLAAGCGNGATIHDRSFSEFCKLPDLHEFDLVVLSGTWSWVADRDRRAIVEFLDGHLADGGIFLVHYEAFPGASDYGNLRNLILDYIGSVHVSGSEIAGRIPGLIDDLRQVIRLNPVFMGDYPEVDDLLVEMKAMPPDHVAHEYFNRNWKPFRFSEMAAMLKVIGLQFAALLDPLENVDAIHLTEPQRKHLAGMRDCGVREATRDFFVRRASRTDCWIRNPSRLSDTEIGDNLLQARFMRTRIQSLDEIVVHGALGEFALAEPEFHAVTDALAPGDVVELCTIAEDLPGRPPIRDVSDRLALLVSAGLIEIVPGRGPTSEEIACSRRLNTQLTKTAAGGEEISTFAAPALAGGFSVRKEDQPFLFGYLDGAREAGELASAAESWLAARAERANVPHERNLHHTLRSQAVAFEEHTLPILQKLAIL